VEQVDSFRLLLPVLRQYGAALCAEPLGTGKTFIALAIASVATDRPAVALVPAALVEQWRATAVRLGVPLEVWSHSGLSMGRLPTGHPGLVIIDESHHFRNPQIRRYRTLAPWLVGRQVLLLTATPVVNHSRDLFHQLHLGIRDDALAADGAGSLRAWFDRGTIPAALGRFVIQRLDGSTRPRSECRTVVAASSAASLVEALESLRLSRDAGTAALVRGVFVRAASSSSAALEGALRRYRNLLLHARDARASGRAIDRATVHRLTFGADEQLLMWELLPGKVHEGELLLSDLPDLEALISRLRGLSNHPDDKVALLRSVLSSGRRSIVFVSARETVTYLRNVLGDHSVAWCTGARSGIGRATLPRATVLDWFRPGSGRGAIQSVRRPTILVATDVVAEGIDLQSAGQLVHYDLPWTDVRREQRNGRVVRRGATHASIEVIQIAPGEEIETRLHQLERLATKAGLPRLHGLGPEGRGVWRWREALARSLPGVQEEGVAGAASDSPGVLVGIALEGEAGRAVSTVLWRGESGWTDDSDAVASRINEAARASAVAPPTEAEQREIHSSLAGPLRALLQQAASHRIAGATSGKAALRLGKRLQQLAAIAARRRDASQLEVLESAFAFVTGGHTAGEERLIETLASLDDEHLSAHLVSLPRATPMDGPLRPVLTGVIKFHRPGHACPASE
jgi:superfamily II DNA or RNA helicase